MMPNFSSTEEAKTYLINIFRKVISDIEQAKTHQDKVKIMKEFDMTEFSAEEQLLNNKKVKDYLEYQKAKSLVNEFFNWIEKEKGINILKASHEDKFFNEMQGNKTLMIALLIQLLSQLPSQDLQAYFVLNIFRTTYELNFKNMVLILHEHLKKQNKKTNDFYHIDTLKNEFSDYLRIDELVNYFRNDMRNPVAHEDWFIKNDSVWTKNKSIEKKQDMMEISRQIYELFYFRVALTTYMLNSYKDFAKSKEATPEQVKQFVEGIKLKIKEIENE